MLYIRVVSYGKTWTPLVSYKLSVTVLQCFGHVNCDNPNSEHTYFFNTSL